MKIPFRRITCQFGFFVREKDSLSLICKHPITGAKFVLFLNRFDDAKAVRLIFVAIAGPLIWYANVHLIKLLNIDRLKVSHFVENATILCGKTLVFIGLNIAEGKKT